jgi:DNA-binding NtrC family response regulator
MLQANCRAEMNEGGRNEGGKPRLTRAGIIQLQNYDWLGNVRELQNVIERTVILARKRGARRRASRCHG